MDRKPEAIFDTLYIGSRIEFKLDDFSHPEIQFFAYLSCLLALYGGNSLSFWEYSFVKTQLGSPYSIDIREAWNFLKSKASVEQTTEGYAKLTEKGRADIDFYLTLHAFKQRVQYLDAACKSLSLIPVGYIKKAIQNEPVLKTDRNSTSRKFLLDESSPATSALYEQFGTLKEALKEADYKDLLIPAVVWIEALNVKEQEQKAI
ncbi:MAG: hypothetical protein SV775_01975 [Thermodesulfobacteriota bacterium]|nr:hypothetical protein [Thermodesulfobacteriota bacterium]